MRLEENGEAYRITQWRPGALKETEMSVSYSARGSFLLMWEPGGGQVRGVAMLQALFRDLGPFLGPLPVHCTRCLQTHSREK